MSFIDAQESETAKRLRDGMTQHSSPFLGFNRAMGSDQSYAPISKAPPTGIERRLISL